MLDEIQVSRDEVLTRCPRFRLSVSAFRNTSGKSTAEPTLR
jgi:hypothetical protein